MTARQNAQAIPDERIREIPERELDYLEIEIENPLRGRSISTAEVGDARKWLVVVTSVWGAVREIAPGLPEDLRGQICPGLVVLPDTKHKFPTAVLRDETRVKDRLDHETRVKDRPDPESVR